MSPANHSANEGNDENPLLKFNIPILPGDKYGLTICDRICENLPSTHMSHLK